jgi:hypothetical protein
MIARIWHGYASAANADAYEKLLREEIIVGIAARPMTGYRGIELLRREASGEVEFVTIMWFDAIEDVRAFAGADHEVAVVPETARRLLSRFDARSSHYDVRKPRDA